MTLRIIAVVVVLLVSFGCSRKPHGLPQHRSTVVPVNRTEPWWKQLHQSNSQRAAQGGEQVQLIFVGDSITELMNTAHVPMEENFGKYHPQEFGISGDSTEHCLWRMQNGELNGLKPKVAVLLIGTNNLNDNSNEQIVDGIRACVKELRKQLPQSKVIVMGLLPRGDGYNIYRKRVAQVNSLLAASGIADNKDIYYADIGLVFLQPDGVIAPRLMPDYLHPSTEGYAAMYAALKPMIDKIIM